MTVASVNKLCKSYETFKLENASFTLKEGRIAGFIGRNGAGKTTTIKSMLGFIHSDSGDISYFGMPLVGNEAKIKQLIGYSTGTVSYYMKKKIKDIISVTKTFYENWSDEACSKYMKLFELDENKTPAQLSEGMKVKLNLTIALSHNAKLLILDEPTSGLDPFSRNDILDIFTALKKEGVSVFFSTHVISDIEKCADDIIYISKGRVKSAESKSEFIKNNSKSGETLEETFLRLERSVSC